MSTIRGLRDKRFKFVMLMRSMFEDPNLSLQAKGLIGFFMAEEKEQEEKDLASVSLNHIEDKESINHIIDECIENGYAWLSNDAELLVSSSKEVIEECKDMFHEDTVITVVR